jgi:hypothetical protein
MMARLLTCSGREEVWLKKSGAGTVSIGGDIEVGSKYPRGWRLYRILVVD